MLSGAHGDHGRDIRMPTVVAFVGLCGERAAAVQADLGGHCVFALRVGGWGGAILLRRYKVPRLRTRDAAAAMDALPQCA